MALVKLGAVATAIKGKVGGTTYKGGAGGAQVIQRKGYRRNANTNTAVSNILAVTPKVAVASASQSWATLTVLQQRSWAASSLNFPYTNRIGEKKTYSGYGLYMKLNVLLNILGYTPLTVPPAKGVVGAQSSNTCTFVVSTGHLNYTPSVTNAANFVTVIELTRAMSKGRQPVSSDFKYVIVEQFTSIAATNILTAYLAIFGAFNVGGQVWCRSVVLNTLTGQSSVAVVVPVTIS